MVDSIVTCGDAVQGILEPNEIDALMKATHRPNYVYRVLANIINNSDLTQQQVFLMDKNLTYFADAIGACERILTTPIPLSWTRKPPSLPPSRHDSKPSAILVACPLSM